MSPFCPYDEYCRHVAIMMALRAYYQSLDGYVPDEPAE
jgi:hypothetical protein